MRIFVLLVALALPGLALAQERPLSHQTVGELKRTVKQDPLQLKAYAYLAAHYLGLREAPKDEFLDSLNLEFESSGAFYNDALVRRERGENRAAIIQLLNAIDADPENLSAYLLMADIHQEMRQPAAVEYYLLQARDRGADPGLVMVQLAEAMLQNGNFEALLNDIPASGDPELRARILTMHARAYLGLRDYEQAQQKLEEALRLKPQLISAQIEQARIGVMRGDLDRARTWLDQASAGGEFHADYWLLRGESARMAGDIALAAEHYQRALSLKEDHLLTLNSLAGAYLDSGQLAAAREVIEQLRTFYPDDLRGLLQAMMLENLAGETVALEEVGVAAKSVIDQLDYTELEKDPYGLMIVGRIHYLSGRMSEAVSMLSQFLEFLPADLSIIGLVADAHLSLGQTGAAVQLVERSEERVGDEPGFWRVAAQSYLEHRDFAKAKRYLDLIIATNPDDVRRLRERRARMNANLGEYDAAITELEALLPDANVVVTLVNLHLALSNYDDVLELTAEQKGYFSGREIDRHNFRGKAYLGLRDYESALTAFNKAYALDPKAAEARFHLGLIDRQYGDDGQAIRRFTKVLQYHPEHRLSMIHLSHIFEDQGDVRKAIRYLRNALAVRTTLSDESRLVRLLVQTGYEQEAREIVTTLKVQRPNNLSVLQLEAEVNLLTDNLDRAHQVYKTMRDVAATEGAVASLVAISRLQFASDDRDGAYSTLDMAGKSAASNLGVLAARAEFSVSDGNYEAAAKAAREVIKQNPDNPIGYTVLGNSLENLGRGDEALEVFREGIIRVPGNLQLVSGYYGLVRSLEGSRQALQFLTRYLEETRANDYLLLRLLAAGFADVGDVDRAIALNSTLLETLPNDPIVLNNQALLLFGKGDGNARRLAQKAYEIAPENYAVMDTLGWILVNEGEVDLGVTMLRNALARSSNVPDIRYHYAVALNRSGQRAAAKRELQSLLADGSDFADREAARQLFDALR